MMKCKTLRTDNFKLMEKAEMSLLSLCVGVAGLLVTKIQIRKSTTLNFHDLFSLVS